jgi:hypothetical protein
MLGTTIEEFDHQTTEKKASIRLNDQDIWNDSTPSTLRETIEKVTQLRRCPLIRKPSLVFVDVENPIARKLQRSLREPMRTYEDIVGFGDRRPEVIGLRVKVESRELVVSLEGVSTASLFIEDDVEKLSANIIVAGSVCFLAVGQVKAGLSLLSAAHSKSDLHQTSNIANHQTSNMREAFANHLARALMALEQYQLLANIARSLWTR